jgi:hypothetical protein
VLRLDSEVIALALHDVGSEVRGWWSVVSSREEARVADEQTADDWVVARTDVLSAVVADPSTHLLEVADPVRRAEEVPCLGDPQVSESAVETAAHHAVMRVMSLEEERLSYP